MPNKANTTKVEKVAKHIQAMWPNLTTWPVSLLGAQPTQAEFDFAHRYNRPLTALAMAWAMYARPQGASDSVAAMAATLATGSNSPTHRTKADSKVKLGLVAREIIKAADGSTCYRLSLPGKPKAASKQASASKPVTAKGKGKPATKGKPEPATVLIKAADMAVSKPNAS